MILDFCQVNSKIGVVKFWHVCLNRGFHGKRGLVTWDSQIPIQSVPQSLEKEFIYQTPIRVLREICDSDNKNVAQTFQFVPKNATKSKINGMNALMAFPVVQKTKSASSAHLRDLDNTHAKNWTHP